MNEICLEVKTDENQYEISSCKNGGTCHYCHSELELLYHPIEYKTRIWEKGSHPLQDFCPHAHTQDEIRDVRGYLQLIDIPPQERSLEETPILDDEDSVHIDQVLELPTKLQDHKIKGMKKSVSLNYTGPGGFEVAFQQTPKKKPGKNKKKKKAKSIQEGKSIDTIIFLDLKLFKVKQCTAGTNHNPKKCLNYHDFKRDRRRPIGSYSSEACMNVAKGGEWPYGDSCQRSHNRVEEFYHPEKYKVKFCSTYPSNCEEWEYGQFWSFAHHVDEIMIDLIDDMEKDDDFYLFHFKTVWCPYTEKKHARDEWVYAHNWQDFRRKPQQFPYSHEQCPQWHSRTFIQVYGDGCKNEFLCPHSHGWKEQEYHPKNYKMNGCRNDTQWAKAHCPYFHNDSQKRAHVQDGFKIQPKNRGSAVSSNEYLAEFIQNQAQILLPQRSQIYRPSTAPFVNSDIFMKQPYYIIHASLGFKDQAQFLYYLSGHAEDQQEHKQKPSMNKNKNKMPRTFSHNSQMNAVSSVPFYPGKGKVMQKPMMPQMNSYKGQKNFPTSVSHGMLVGMGNQVNHNMYGPPPGLQKSMMSQNNIYRGPVENEAWRGGNYVQPEMGYTNPQYMQWHGNGSQMIPQALQSHQQISMPVKAKKASNIKGSMSTEFHYNFGSKLINEPDDRYGQGFMENNSDSDDEIRNQYNLFGSHIEPIQKFGLSSINDVNEHEDHKH